MISRPTKEEVQRAACILAYSGHKFVNTAELAALREQRKVMLDEIRKRVYKYSYADWHRMLMEILDEMEAKL